MKKLNSFTPKEGAGRSNRLGDANKNKGLQLIAVGPFFYQVAHRLQVKNLALVSFADFRQQKARSPVKRNGPDVVPMVANISLLSFSSMTALVDYPGA